MKKIKSAILSILLVLAFVPAVAQNYESMWKKVYNLQKKGRTASAIANVNKIYSVARKKNNELQMCKVIAYKWDLYRGKSDDSTFVCINEMKSLVDNCKNDTLRLFEKAFYAAMCKGRAAYWSEEIFDFSWGKEKWSGKMFEMEYESVLKDILAEAGKYAGVSNKKYRDIIEVNEDDIPFKHDILSTICFSFNFESKDSYMLMYEAYGKRNDYVDAEIWAFTRLMDFEENKAAIEKLEGALRNDRYKNAKLYPEIQLKIIEKYNNENSSKALEYCDDFIKKYPKYRKIDEVKSIQQNITKPYFSTHFNENVLYPNEKCSFKVEWQNIGGFKLNWYKIDDMSYNDIDKLQKGKKEELLTLKKKYKVSESVSYHFADKHRFSMADSTLYCTAPGYGMYMVETEPIEPIDSDYKIDEKSLKILFVSSLSILKENLPSGESKLIIIDSKSGHIADGAKLVLADDTLHNANSDDATYIINKRAFRARAVMGNDEYMPFGEYFGHSKYVEPILEDKAEAALFTDRAIYRPSQNVHAGGFVYRKQGDVVNTIAGETLNVIMKEGKNVLKTVSVKTDSYGGYCADFTLPATMSGNGVVLIVEGSSLKRLLVKEVVVEEYKLPEFKVEIDSIKQRYTWGDSLTFSGKAVTFSGMPVANASVIARFNNTQEQYIWTDDNGCFSVKVKLPEMEHSEMENPWKRYICNFYSFYARVTSESGETEEGYRNIRIANLPVDLTIDFPEKVMNDASSELKFNVENAMGAKQDLFVKYNIYKAVMKNEEQVRVGEPLLSGSFQSNIAFQPMDIYNFESGRYTIEAICYDTIKVEKQFVLFSLDDDKPVEKSPIWCYNTSKYFNQETPACFQVGTSFNDAWIYCDVFSGNKCVDSRIIKCDDSNSIITYDYLPEYGDGILVNMVLVKNGRQYSENFTVKKSKPEKNLVLKWSTFRDKLAPGQKEIWKLNVTKPDGSPADAQVLATMYDGSLDMLREYYWDFSYNCLWRIPSNLYWHYRKGESNLWLRWYFTNKNHYAYYSNLYGHDEIIAAPKNEDNVAYCCVVEEDVHDDENYDAALYRKTRFVAAAAPMVANNKAVESSIIEENVVPSTVAPRTNLSETAFFYPALQTDKDGIATISFTLPEGLTTWKFKAVAHTRQLENGTISSDVVAQKMIMIKPQMPRFLRKGDKAQITAMLYNKNAKSVGGTAFITIFDPLTEAVVVSKKQAVSLKANGSSAVTFAFDAPVEDKIYACKMIVETSLGSDGEQQYLPVLPDETLLTESLPFMWKDKGTHEETLDSLFCGQKSVNGKYAMTVQYSANPVWYAVQALPSLTNSDSHTSFGAMLGYYSSSLARHIANSNPKIKTVVDVWKQDKTGQSLVSALKMNADLKEIPLEESLWEDAANSETVRKQQIAELFDENKMGLSLERAIDKLKTFQNPDGGFAWCNGIRLSSYFVTSQIMESFAHLLQLRTSEKITSAEKEIISKAIAFMDKEIPDELKQKDCFAEKMLLYYHARTMLSKYVGCDREASALIKKIEGRFGDYLKDPRLLSMYGRAALSSALIRNNRKKDAEDLCVSILENTVSRKQSGRYFEGRMNFWGSNMKMDCHAHVIEALSEWIKNDSSVATRTLPDGTTYVEALAQMRVWLLNQKRTNGWDNPMESVNAVYALMCNENADLSAETTGNKLTVCGHEVDMKSEIAAIGFCSDKWIAESTDNTKLTLDKANDGISWGAVYAQYKVKDSDVKQKGEELRIEREYFVERNVNGKVQNIPLRNTTLAVGDRIVQHIYLVAMTDLDYIQIEVPRAACAEPSDKHSGYRWSGSIGFYESVKDTKSQIFIAHLPKGRHTINTSMFIDRKGTYSTGVATVRCAYDSAYGAHTASAVLQVR